MGLGVNRRSKFFLLNGGINYVFFVIIGYVVIEVDVKIGKNVIYYFKLYFLIIKY